MCACLPQHPWLFIFSSRGHDRQSSDQKFSSRGYDRQSSEQNNRKLISLHNNGEDDKHADLQISIMNIIRCIGSIYFSGTICEYLSHVLLMDFLTTVKVILHQFWVKKMFPWKFNLEYGGTFTNLFMHVSSRNMFPTIRNRQICVHVYRPRHCCRDWLTFGCFVPMIALQSQEILNRPVFVLDILKISQWYLGAFPAGLTTYLSLSEEPCLQG
jgi:hypothetical protein